ncbi:FAD-dependent oxidoreductase [Edaphocola flava]|uniref:FAD-dependent oxidoreductase n=1 Tax=Edaphocola flava TaxID=2499629 RepID=UPI00100ADCCF|nr:NAD(P)/FAD-dependent oxidoreductase [Edaphocola flava]
MLVKDKKIAVVGGGPGGLTLARLLQMKGAQLKVYERDAHKEVRVQGATLDLHETSGLEALRRAGLTEAFYKHYRPEAGKLRIIDTAGYIHHDEHDGTDSFAEDRPEIDRGPLRNILMDSLLPDTIVWDSQFTSMQEEGQGWLLNFKNGHSAYADLVIAADGANSRIRPYITDIQPVYSGITIVEGTIYHAATNAPDINALVQGGKVFALSGNQSLILSAKGDGSLSFYTGTAETEDWLETCGIDFTNKHQVHRWFIKRFCDWSPFWHELFANDEVFFIPRPQYHFPSDQQWIPKSNVTMLGDAAHRMPPYAGEGVNMAMQDAYELAECLTGSQCTNMQSAITTYETQMRRRAAEVTEQTLYNTQMLHSEGALNNILKIMQGA